MIIREVELSNFRIYKGVCKVDLLPQENKNIFIVSGRNGFGKTTFLMSLVWCLYGKQMQDVDDLYYKEISDQGGYSKYIANSLNRLAKTEGETIFYVSITFTDVNIPDLPCNEIKIIRRFDIESSAADSVEILIDGYENELTKEVGQEIFIRDFILPKEIAKFFFFDAEKIVTLAEINTAEQRRKLSLAYSEVLGIKKYEDLKSQLEDLQIKLRQESASPKERKELNELKASVKNCEVDIKDKSETIENLKEQIVEKRKASNDIQEKLIRAGSSITVEELNELKDKEAKHTEALNDFQAQLKESFDIIPFAIAGNTFLEISKQLDGETNYKKIKFQQENIQETTDKVLNDLLIEEKPKDIYFDHKVHNYYTELIGKLIRKHFFSSTPELPNDFTFLHDFSDTQQNELNALLSNIKMSFKETFLRINSEVNLIKNELNLIRRKIRDAESRQEDPIIADYRLKKIQTDNEIFKAEQDIESLSKEIGEKNFEKGQHQKKIVEISRKLDVSTKNKAKDDMATRYIGNLKKFLSTFKIDKKKSLENQILKGLETLMHKKSFIRNVSVDIIEEDIDIRLFNARNEEIRKESLSKGEQQMYATALLRGLVEESDIDFPVFIDSPMQKFDELHSENIVRYFYPNISDQVILFPLINKELTQQEYKILLKNISGCYLIHNTTEDKSEFIKVDPDKFISEYNTLYQNVN